MLDQVGVDYAGPILMKSGSECRPIIIKSYICVFVSFSVKAVHIKPMTELTMATFTAALRRFVVWCGKPSRIWSDQGNNIVKAAREVRELYEHLRAADMQHCMTAFCSQQGIEWSFMPEHTPHFRGFWGAAINSFKPHFKQIVRNVRLSFKELAMVSTLTEACLIRSR